MKPIWNKVNKAIGIINLIVGFVLLYVIFDLTQKQVAIFKNLSGQNGFTTIDVSFFELLFRNRIQPLNGILFILSGILILLRKKLGWIFGYSCWIITTLILIPMTIYGIRDVTVTTIGFEYWPQIYSGIGLLAGLTFLITLSLKPVRVINKINRYSWLLSFGIVLLIYLTQKIL